MELELPKTKTLCTERINFLNGAINAITDKKQKEEFQYVKYLWDCCLNAINGKYVKGAIVTDKETGKDCTFKHYAEAAIKPYLNFQKQMRKLLEDSYEKVKEQQEQTIDEGCKTMTQGEFSDYTIQHEKILGKYNEDIWEAELCLSEIKRAWEKEKN